MVRVRFAPSPTGSLHLGSALTAVANRRFADERGGTMTLRIDDTDRARRDPGAEAGIVADLEWLGVRYEAGPLRQSERGDQRFLVSFRSIFQYSCLSVSSLQRLFFMSSTAMMARPEAKSMKTKPLWMELERDSRAVWIT